MPSLRTKSISTKVTDEEYAQMEALAGGQTISEWARDVLLRGSEAKCERAHRPRRSAGVADDPAECALQTESGRGPDQPRRCKG